MSRLIDADKLLEELRQYHPLSISYGILSDIEYFPTAYDIDKVVEQLDICSANHFLKGNHYDEGVRDAYYYAIDIVMKGGAE